MKKLAIGCLVVLVVVGAAVAGIGYYGYLKVKSTVTQLAELGQIGDLERGVRIKTAFVAPASRELTAAQVDRLLQVQARVRERLGAGAAAIERNYKSLLDKKDATAADLPALLGAYRDLARTLIDAKKAQVEALNDLGLSLDEYRWIRTESYRALGVPFVDMDVSRIAERARNGQTAGVIEMNGALGDKGPDANARLVEKHRKALEDYMALASFGL
jgi:hypothetical protein